jgi:hypothetical protein
VTKMLSAIDFRVVPAEKQRVPSDCISGFDSTQN